MEPKAIDYIKGDTTVWEGEPMEKLAKDGMLAAYRHYGYWQNMDSLRDKNVLDQLWQDGNPPWKIW
jgi:glucose-1-phosphate cytidylyltransferase